MEQELDAAKAGLREGEEALIRLRVEVHDYFFFFFTDLMKSDQLLTLFTPYGNFVYPMREPKFDRFAGAM